MRAKAGEAGYGHGPLWREQLAQGTVEYALVLLVFMAIVGALVAIWRASADGALTATIERAASHALDATGIPDIILY